MTMISHISARLNLCVASCFTDFEMQQKSDSAATNPPFPLEPKMAEEFGS
jgi:hypothetical protein